MENNNKKNFSLLYLLFVLLITVIISVSLTLIIFLNLNLEKQVKEKVIENEVVQVVSEDSQVIEVAKNASQAVVSIVATAEVPIYENYMFGDPFFQQFFEFEEPQEERERVQVGAGTGFIVSADGYIITNRHVVDDTQAEYTVFLNNQESQGEKVLAQVIALDPNYDLAILKIEKENLPYLEFGNSDDLQVGQTAITIGYALGEFENTLSKGIISGLSRSIIAGSAGRRSQRLYDLIQTDAAINFGNSGGPMLNILGQVVGVNVAMAQAENIGFAIPGNVALAAFEEVKETGEISKQASAFLGVRYLTINANLQERNRLPYDYGALIIRGETREDLAVLPGSPADKAGLKENDIILELNGEKITERRPLFEIIREYSPDDEVVLKVFEKGEEKEIEVILGSSD
jgi:serine protease Do